MSPREGQPHDHAYDTETLHEKADRLRREQGQQPEVAELRAAAAALRDVAPDITGPLAGLADPVADWLDDAAVDAEQIGPNHRAVTVARTILGEA